ncbi:PREDICTED: uncharacterized protein LOC108354097 [Rhagoletis zephyria]|uniref:uncharacterized protein LOC108354097 n=1 Tax=Rhagoletis zephyria TaxID=28612 RepID=UPI000811927B|nr:PREDICTED: uncharacterized protein LOC108354097 [Rhagoletis zephyria]
MEFMYEEKYVPHKLKAEDKGSVWYYFLPSASGGPTAQCKTCNKVLKTCLGSTKGLLTHLKFHKIELERKPGQQPVKVSGTLFNKCKPSIWKCMYIYHTSISLFQMLQDLQDFTVICSPTTSIRFINEYSFSCKFCKC